MAARPGVEPEHQARCQRTPGSSPATVSSKEACTSIVTLTGELRTILEDHIWGHAMDGGHTSLAEREPFFMTGIFRAEKGKIAWFGSYSGHDMPKEMDGYMSLEEIAQDAFSRFGLRVAAEALWAGSDLSNA
jgi:hypothetical protein